jgi:hypothetical protein
MAGVSHQQLLTLIAKGKPVPGILLLGGESYLRELCRRKIIEAYVAEGVRDWGITRFSAEDDELSAIVGQAQTLPMLAAQQVMPRFPFWCSKQAPWTRGCALRRRWRRRR